MLHFLLSGQRYSFKKNGRIFILLNLDMKHEWVKYTFQQLSGILLEQEILLIGFIREGEKRFKPPVKTELQAGDSLLIVAKSM